MIAMTCPQISRTGQVESLFFWGHMPREASYGLDEALDMLGFKEIRDSNNQSSWVDTRKLTHEIAELGAKLKMETERAETAERRAERAERHNDILVRTLDAIKGDSNLLATVLEELLVQRHIDLE